MVQTFLLFSQNDRFKKKIYVNNNGNRDKTHKNANRLFAKSTDFKSERRDQTATKTELKKSCKLCSVTHVIRLLFV